MSRTLADQRCFNHADREAAARCPSCRKYFCRECVTEYDDRVVCAGCLKKLSRLPSFKRRGWQNTIAFGQCVLGLFMAWFFFYLIGEILLALPSSFHEGTFWRVQWWHEK
jgi:hypothetical protein